MFPAIFPNARIWPGYELKCTFRKRNNLFPDSQCFTYESSQALDLITGLVNSCNIEHSYIWLLCWLICYADAQWFIWLIADLSDQLTDRPLLQSVPPGWLAERTDSKMDVWMSKCPDMPTIWTEMHIWESWKSFFSNLAFHLHTTDKPPGKFNTPTVKWKSCFSFHCNQAGTEVTTLTADWTDGKTDDCLNCRMRVCKKGKTVTLSVKLSTKQSAM